MSNERNIEFDDFSDGLIRESSDRTIIILGASMIEDQLFRLIRGFVLDKLSPGNNPDELLEGDTPLSTFSAKSKIAYRLGLIDRSLYDILETTRKIRNLGAHQLVFNVNTSPVKEHIGNLVRRVRQRNSYKLTETRYFEGKAQDPQGSLKCSLLAVNVVLETLIRTEVKITTDEKILQISGN